MTDYRKLYDLIFRDQHNSFNAQCYYYTVFIDCANKISRQTHEKFYNKFNQQFENTFATNSIKRFNYDDNDLKGEFANLQRDTYNINKNFVYFVDLSVDIDADDHFVETFEKLKHYHTEAGDHHVIVLLLLPYDKNFNYIDGDDDGDPCKSILADTRKVSETLIYNHDRYYDDSDLPSSVICAIKLLSNKESFNRLKQLQVQYSAIFDRELDQMQSEKIKTRGKQYPVKWMSIAAFDQNNRFIMFKDYISALYSNTEKLSGNAIKDILAKSRNTFESNQSNDKLKKLLIKSFDSIPITDNNSWIEANISFINKIEHLYGDKAENTIKLTFKAMLSKHSSIQNIENELANEIFVKSVEFGEESLFESICSSLSEYTEKVLVIELKNAMQDLENLKKKSISGEKEFFDARDDYVEIFVRCDTIKKWIYLIKSVEQYITLNKDKYIEECKKSNDIFCKVDHQKEEIKNLGQYRFENVPSKKREMLLNAFSDIRDHNEELYETIKTTLENNNDQVDVNPDEIFRHIFKVEPVVQLHHMSKENFDDMGVAYLCIGKYLIDRRDIEL